MKRQIKHFSIHQTSKIIALFYLIVTAVIMFPIGVYTLFGEEKNSALLFFVWPFVYWGVIYVVMAGVTWIYNGIAHSFGGIEFDLEEPEAD